MNEQIKINMGNLTKSEQEELTGLIKKARVVKRLMKNLKRENCIDFYHQRAVYFIEHGIMTSWMLENGKLEIFFIQTMQQSLKLKKEKSRQY